MSKKYELCELHKKPMIIVLKMIDRVTDYEFIYGCVECR